MQVDLTKYLTSTGTLPARETDAERCERLVRQAQSKGHRSLVHISRYAGMTHDEVRRVLKRQDDAREAAE